MTQQGAYIRTNLDRMEKCTRGVDNKASCSKARSRAKAQKARPKATEKRTLLERKAEYKEYRRLLTSLMFNNPRSKIPPKKPK